MAPLQLSPVLFPAIVVLFLATWQVLMGNAVTPRLLAGTTAIVTLCWVYGGLAERLGGETMARVRSAPLRFLCGYVLFNSALFVLLLTSPSGIAADVGILGTAGVALALVTRRRRADAERARLRIELACVLIAAMAATLWCVDALSVPRPDGNTLIVRLWQDVFVHVRLISSFAQSHGFGSFSDIQAAGLTPRMYHYAPYASAAAMSALTGVDAYDAFGGFYLPFGLLLVGLAAYSFASAIWGAWPGVAAMVAITLLPDAYQQGFGNRYLSYYFMQQVNPGGMFGVVTIAIAWTLMLDACAHRSYRAVAMAYVVTALTAFYKAQIFVANALLILVYPALFLPGIRTRWRVVSALSLTALFAGVVMASQRTAAIPTLRLDGSSLPAYVAIVLNGFDPGTLKDVFGQWFVAHQTKLVAGAVAAAMLALCTFGLWLAAGVAGVAALYRRARGAVLLFPVLVIVNYLVMSVGLAMDEHGIGTPDELLNRPLVWACFALVAWSAGALYARVWGDAWPDNLLGRTVLAVLLCGAFATPLLHARNLQTFPAWNRSFADLSVVPVCLAKASTYVRDHSAPGDVVQDSENDSHLAVTALSERQAYLAQNFLGVGAERVGDRIDALAQLRTLTDDAAIRAFMHERHISWYILGPESQVAWPYSLMERVVFRCGGYSVYRFAP